MRALYGVCLLKGHYKKLHSQVAFHSYGNLPKIIAVAKPCQEPPEIFQPFQTQNHYNCPKLSKYVWNLPDFWEPLKYFQNIAIRLQFFQKHTIPLHHPICASIPAPGGPLKLAKVEKNLFKITSLFSKDPSHIMLRSLQFPTITWASNVQQTYLG